jgi:hypothetical protein
MNETHGTYWARWWLLEDEELCRVKSNVIALYSHIVYFQNVFEVSVVIDEKQVDAAVRALPYKLEHYTAGENGVVSVDMDASTSKRKQSEGM